MAEDTAPGPGKPIRPKRRWLGWVAGVLGATATAVLVPFLSQNVTNVIANVSTTGQPIAIHTTLEPALDDVSIPASQQLSAADLAKLSTMKPKDEDTWLAAHKQGVITSTRTLALTLTGNRPQPVRITGISVDSTCVDPDRGTMVRMAVGRGDGVASERMEIDAEDPDPQAYSYDASSKKTPYFPGKTIVLKQGEDQEVVVDVNPSFAGQSDPTRERLCDVHMTLQLLQQGKESTEKIPAAVRVMGIEAMSADDDYKHVYLGTGICKTVVPAPAGWMQDSGTDDDNGCGPGNNASF